MTWEIDFLNAIQTGLANPVFDTFFRYFTLLGEPVVFIVFCAILLLPNRTRKMGIQISLALIIGVLFGNLILKNAFARPRPFTQPGAVIDAARLLIKQPTDYSFPSGHALASTNAAMVLFLNNKRWGALALFGAALISFSRMYLFVHYPTDILGGIAIGLASSIISYTVCKKLFERYTFELHLPLRKAKK